MKDYLHRLLALIIAGSLLLSPLPVSAFEQPRRMPSAGGGVNSRLLMSAPVTPEGGGELRRGGVSLRIPPGAVDETVMVSVLELSNASPMNSGRANVTHGAAGYRFLPAGLRFSEPVQVTLPYDRGLNESETALSNLYTYFFNTHRGRWQRLRRVKVDKEAAAITSLTTHFTDMVNTTLTLPEGPQPIEFDLNSIKNLEAARPDALFSELEGLEGGWNGGASFSIPLALPPGRGGASPQLSLNYQSGGAAGLMGSGFSVPIGTVETDTRFGVPDYNGEDRYLLDGEELVRVESDTAYHRYRMRKEGRFARIRRYRNTAADTDYWEITDKDGTRRYYGWYDSSKPNNNAWLGPDQSSPGRGVFRWYLSRIIDVDGNTVDYRYEYVAADKNVYPAAAAWSGRSGSDAFDGTGRGGCCRVYFDYDLEGRMEADSASTKLGYSIFSGTAHTWAAGRGRVREDRRIDARGGFPSASRRRLDRIRFAVQSSGGTRDVRSWDFFYRMDEFGRTLLDRYERRSAGESEPLYSYGFDYHGLEEEGSGYSGFGSVAERWAVGPQAVSRAPDESRSNSTSVSLGLDLSLFIDLIIFKINILKFGVRGGLSGGSNLVLSDMSDINGDGVPELAWKMDSSLSGYIADPRTGRFRQTLTSLSGLTHSYSSGETRGANIGLSVGFGPVSGGITRQWNWSDGKSAPMDVNGDGFVDFVSLGSASFLRNDGRGNLQSTPWRFETGSPGELQDEYSAGEQADIANTYYREDPLRRWSAYRSGVVVVDDEISYAAGAGSDDGLTAEIHVPGETDPNKKLTQLTITPGSPSAKRSSGARHTVAMGDKIYFRLNPKKNERGDRVKWRSKIRYESIALFEDMEFLPVLIPPPTPVEEPWFTERPELKALYSRHTVKKGTPPADVVQYRLVNDWRSKVNSKILDKLIADSLFLPRRIPGKQFRQFLINFPISLDENKDRLLLTAFQKAFYFDAIEDQYVLIPEKAAGITDMANMANRFLADRSFLDKKKFFEYILLGSRVTPIPDADESSFTYESAKTEKPPQGVLLPSSGTLKLGEQNDLGHTLLDQFYDDDGKLLFNVTLRPSETVAGGYQVIQKSPTGTEDVIEATITKIEPKPKTGTKPKPKPSLQVTFERLGIAHRNTLINPVALPQRLPSSYYETIIDNEFSEHRRSVDSGGLHRIAAAAWNALRTQAQSLKITLPDNSYQSRDGEKTFILNSALNADDARTVWSLWESFPKKGPNNAFFQLSSDAANVLRPALLTQSALNTLDAQETMGLNLTGFFEAVTTNNGARFVVKSDLTAEQRVELAEALRRYERDKTHFDYYDAENTPTSSTRVLKSGLTKKQKETVEGVFKKAGVRIYTTLERALKYNSKTQFPLTEIPYPGANREDRVSPGQDGANGGWTRGTTVLVPVHDASGKNILKPRYIHIFDSRLDFAALDIVKKSNASLSKPADGFDPDQLRPYLEPMNGGVYGWFYGVWNARHDWNPENFGKTPDIKAHGTYKKGSTTTESASQRRAPLPPYHSQSVPNDPDPKDTTQAGENQKHHIDRWGLEKLPVPGDVWTGPVSERTESDFDDAGNVMNTTYQFAALIDAEGMWASRRGGDFYWNLPSGGGLGGGGGSLSLISATRGSSTDINGGLSIGPANFNVAHNSGSSYQYGGLQDINGDRYPDLIRFSQSGGKRFIMRSGTGGGFKPPIAVNSELEHLAVYKNVGYSIGGSLGAGSGGSQFTYDEDGSPNGFNTNKEAGNSVSVSAGQSTTFSLAESIQTSGLSDINGDGLPDQVSRPAGGGFTAYLNTGGRFTTPARTYSGGINESVASNFGDLQGHTHGLSYSHTGSLGGTVSVNVNVGGGPVSAGLGTSFGFGSSVTKTNARLMDINGDGLPDHVVKKPSENYFRVKVNTGEGFAPATLLIYRPSWATPGNLEEAIRKDLRTISNKLNDTSVPGVNKNKDNASHIKLPKNPPGGDFTINDLNPYEVQDLIEYQMGMNISLGGNLSLSFSWILIALTVSFGVNGSYAQTSTSLGMQDITGDGLPDHYMKYPNQTHMQVKRNSMGKVGLLKHIALPQGGDIAIEYTPSLNTTANPNHRWLMSAVTRSDNREDDPAALGVHSYRTEYRYQGALYERNEREFLGFAQVTAARPDGSKIITAYQNTRHIEKGLISSRRTLDDTGLMLSLEENTYAEYILESPDITGDPVPAYRYLQSQSITRYETSSGAAAPSGITTTYTYDFQRSSAEVYGNIITLREEPLDGGPEDTLELRIRYSSALADTSYRVNLPIRMEVKNGNRSLLRKREGRYDLQGRLISLLTYSDGETSHISRITWNSRGLLESITDPRGTRVQYTYDSTAEQYVTRITTSGIRYSGYTSSMTWNYDLGLITSRTDPNGLTKRSTYDGHGRPLAVYTPYDTFPGGTPTRGNPTRGTPTGGTPAVRYSYEKDRAGNLLARTFNKVSTDSTDGQTIDTLIRIDGLGRPIYTAKSGFITTTDGISRSGWNVSGALEYDNRGRTVAEGQPVFSPGSANPAPPAMVNPTRTLYDTVDRPTRITLPDGSITSYAYAIRSSTSLTTLTDPQGNITETASDPRGRITGITKKAANLTPLMSTSFTYDILGQLRENSISDIQTPGAPVQTSSITYDLRGLQTRLESPETGITDLAYDDAGSLIRKVTPNLRREGKAITYTYDPLGRIAGIDYPDMRDVTYTYGAQGAPHNSAGRLVSRRDESGSIAYRYGLMGEVTYEERSLERLTPLEPERSAAMRYRSDYLGRMASITYPDGEVITYSYDPGGQVTGIDADRSDGTRTVLVKKIGYDEYGQRTYLEYGNGNITTYTYDEQRRWMDTLKTQNTRSGVTLQNLTYRFDTVGNVLSRGEVTSRYSTSQNYTYDALYQLTGALGDYTERPAGIDDWRQEYSQNFSYDALGNITQKTSTQTRFPQSSGALNLNYQLNYEYDENNPRQATRIGEMYYGYDPNGNLIEESVIPVGRSRAGQAANITQIGKVRMADQGFGLVNNPEDDASLYRRMFSWDEENRLKKIQDPSNTVRFLYDADGMRTVKHSREGETLYYNTWWSETEDLPGFRRSKHIYLGSERIVSRLSIEEAGPNYEDLNTYYYHPDHLGSVHSVSDAEGNPYERIEYTPFGEMWIEIREDANTKDLNYIPYRFTSKEWDSETGLYSFPARYFEPKLSRWMSADPAGFELMNPMEEDREGRMKKKQDYSVVEAANWYSYTSNRPITNIDPTGLDDITIGLSFDVAAGGNKQVPGGIATNLGIVVDTDEPLDSGIYFSFGESTGGGASVGLGVGYYPEEIEGKSVNFSVAVPLSQPLLGISGEINIDPDSGKVSGGSISASFGGGITVTETKTITPITVGQVISFVKKVGEYLDKRGQQSPYK